MASARRTIMAAFDPATLERWRALAIVDRDGTTVGTISEFYLDRETGDPTWALVETGLFGMTQTFVPLVHATEIADGLQVPYEKRHIRNSPRVDPHDELTPDEEARLFAHYGVDYQPFTDPGPGPVPVDATTAQEVEAVPEEPGTTAAPGTLEDPEPIPEEPGTTDDPATAAGEPGTAEEREAAGGAEAVPGSHGTAEDAAVVDEPGSDEGAASAPTESGEPAGSEEPAPEEGEGGERALVGGEEPTSAESGEPTRIRSEEPSLAESAEPAPMGSEESAPVGSDEAPAPMASEESALPGSGEPPTPIASEEESGTFSGEPGIAEGPGREFPEAGPGSADDDTLIGPGGHWAAPDHPEGPSDPDLSRTAPVEPGLPGSTAASLGPVPTTVDKDGDDPDRPRAGEPSPDQDEPQWAPAPAGSFDEPDPSDRGGDSSDRWREAKLAAERDRIARAAAAQPEERSPLERARRRLERLVGVGQDHSDDEISPSEREEAERARRARLGFDEDDPRFR
jgi:hypothetical protein